MKTVRSARLWFREGSSDKVYEVDLLENDALPSEQRYLVNFRYGRRGATLREGSKTPAPVALASATKIFDSIIVSKVNDGYRRTDEPTSGAIREDSDDIDSARDENLLSRLEACIRSPWPAKDLDRLLWRIGQLKLDTATDDLLRLASRKGATDASYSLVWALTRAAGPAAAQVLSDVADTSKSATTRELARFALVSPLMGEAKRIDDGRELPPSLAEAAASGNPDSLTGALVALAERDSSAAGPALCTLYRMAQNDRRLHGALADVLLRMPARPPWLIGLRRLFKYAEMIDDAAIFAATAHRFETASAMYTRNRYSPWTWIPELQKRVRLEKVLGEPDTEIGLSDATLHYFKRRIWRTLRKRGEEGDGAFTEMAAAFLLSFRPQDLPATATRSRWVQGANNRWHTETRTFGPFSRNWTASQLLGRNNPGMRFGYGSLTSEEAPASGASVRGEAFPELWDKRPDLALELACESACKPVSDLGVRLLQAAPEFLRTAPAATLARLLRAHDIAAQGLGLAEARERLARGESDPKLLTALISAHTPDARRLALARIDATPSLPWSDAELSLAVLTGIDEDIAEQVQGWARERQPDNSSATAIVERLVAWLEQHPPVSDTESEAQLRLLRKRIAILWANAPMPVAAGVAMGIADHSAPAVAAVGIEMLALSGADVSTIDNATWERLLGSPSPDVQTAALRLFGRLNDAALNKHTALVLAFATAPSHQLRIAARPLVQRLVASDPQLAEDLSRRLVDSLFLAAPDDDWPQDTVDLLYAAMPQQVSAIDSNMLWRLLQARAKGAQLLGSTELLNRPHDIFSVRQLARLGNHPHVAARNRAMEAFSADPVRFQAEAQDAVLLVESDWPDTLAFARDYFTQWPPEAWTPATLAVITDSVKPEVLALARRLLRSHLSPEDAPVQLVRLLEHPARSMHLLVTELLTADSVASEDAFEKLLPLARIIMLQVHQGRVAKDRISAFLLAEALRDRNRAERIAPLFSDLSLAGVARDRSAAILALRDIARMHEGIEMPLVRRAITERVAR